MLKDFVGVTILVAFWI